MGIWKWEGFEKSGKKPVANSNQDEGQQERH